VDVMGGDVQVLQHGPRVNGHYLHADISEGSLSRKRSTHTHFGGFGELSRGCGVV
jgi:hypothetical protein